MFKEGDIVKVVDFSNDVPGEMYKLADDHPYRKLGDGKCVVVKSGVPSSKHVHVRNLKNDYSTAIYKWRCVIIKSATSWEV